MDKLGHNFEELGPEFDSVPFLAQAMASLSQSTTSTGARARNFLEEARRALHPAALDPECHIELSAKRAERSERASRDRQPAKPDDRDNELTQLREKIAALEKAGSVRVGEGA